MHVFRRLTPALLGLAACGGQPAAAQTPAPPDDGLAHAYLYQVAQEAPTPQEAPGFIEVSGSAEVSVSPDLARASFAVETHADSAADAAGTNATTMGAVVRALRSAGIDGLRVETFGYTLRPEYSYPTVDGQRTRVVAGYTALNNVRATVPDVNAMGRVIDVAIGAGANRVSSLTFEASDTEAARTQALAQAVREARAQAQAIAAALGRALGAPLEVRGGSQQPSPRPQAGILMRAEAAAPTPVEAADQTVSASVTIRFALGPATGGR